MLLPSLKELNQDHKIISKKKLGQNFIFDTNLTKKIVKTAKPLDGTIIEIGPGPGSLTRTLLIEGANKIFAIETDKNFINILKKLELASSNKLQLIHGNALKEKLWQLGQSPRQVVANLPYNISTKIFIKLLENSEHFSGMSLMFQREVAERIVAKSGQKHFGRLSIFTSWKADAKIIFDIQPHAFKPKPKVLSSLVRIIPKSRPEFYCQQENLQLITRICFNQRRKMMRSILKKYGGENLLNSLGINPLSRPENLKVRDYCNLANKIFGS